MKMAVLLLVALSLLALAPPSSGSYCICKQGLSDAVLQKAIDYACGAGADCNPIRPNGQCYNPNTVVSHCSYAVNNYYQRKASSGATCDFGGAAMLSNSAPSGSCASSGSSGSTGTGATGPVTTVPSTSPPTGTTPTTTPISGGTPTTTPISGGTPTTTPVSGGTGTGGVGVTPTGTTPTTTSPYSTTPTPFGGIGMAPTGSSLDDNSSGIERASLGSILAAILISGIMCWWN